MRVVLWLKGFWQNMANLLLYEFILVFLLCCSTEAFPHSGRGSRVQRNVDCGVHLYLDGNICCLNCPAGTHVKSPCTTGGQMGTCQECEYGKHTEHANGLHQCLKCTVCRSDQEAVTQCTTTRDTICQCKAGTFCAPDQACELCRKCSTCKEGEETVRNCTATTNTQCKTIQSNPDSTGNNYEVMVTLVVIFSVAIAAVIIVIGLVYGKKRCRASDAQRNLPDGVKVSQNFTEEMRNGESQRPSFSGWATVRPKSSAALEDEHKRLVPSLNSSASNSQYSLTGLLSSASLAPQPQAHLKALEQLNLREDELFLKLIPVNGQESLRQCFRYFEEVNFDYHKRFFRNLGIKDNIIKSKEHLPYEDKIHELLNIWMENVGRDADLSELLRALLDLNQRHTAEAVRENAVHDHHYTVYE